MTTFKTLTMDAEAINTLDSAFIEDSWFKDFNVPDNSTGLRRVVLNNHIFILSEKADLDSPLSIINIHDTLERSNAPRKLFERITRVSLRLFFRNITIPLSWQPFHHGSLISIYTESAAKHDRSRICIEQAPNGNSNNIYSFLLTEKPQNLSINKECLSIYTEATELYLDALIENDKSSLSPNKAGGNFGIVLEQPLGSIISTSGSLDDWINRLLNTQQSAFVGKNITAPIRLRGAAGTGKTQAMAVKCLKEIYDTSNNSDKTFAFLTHSSALAHEIIRGMFYSMDPSMKWSKMQCPDGNNKLWIGTIYELAEEILGFNKKGLEPLSLDGSDGRELQRIMITDAIKKVIADPRIALGLMKNDQQFLERLRSLQNGIVDDIMNEFACILDAEHIKKGSAQAERYINSHREAWQMPLNTLESRETIIEIHDEYKSILRKAKLLSMDQMIADFGHYLATHEWSQLRERNGFDVIFVDEYHYFTRSETMVLQSLFKTRAEHSGRWPLIMSYDLKQSTNDAAFSGANGLSRFKNPGVGESTPVELSTIYRYTPEIAAFLSDIDASFPAMDLEGEFNIPTSDSQQTNGDKPKLLVYEDNIQLIDSIFEEASKLARSSENGGKSVAVLCMNEDLFEKYRHAGRLKGKSVTITSREDFRELRYARSKFVFSMPYFVAGLQFDNVFIIHVDALDMSDDFISQGSRRRYVSMFYLGASRSVKKLFIASSSSRGGPNSLLKAAINNNTLISQVVGNN